MLIFDWEAVIDPRIDLCCLKLSWSLLLSNSNPTSNPTWTNLSKSGLELTLFSNVTRRRTPPKFTLQNWSIGLYIREVERMGVQKVSWVCLEAIWFSDPNFFKPKIFLDPKFFWTQNFLDQNFFGTQNFLEPKIFWDSKFLGIYIFSWPKFFWVPIFFRSSNFFWT